MKNKPTSKMLSAKTGKDLLKLIQTKGNTENSEQRKLPSNEQEIQHYSIWKAVLGHDDFGINDDFFKVGGSSIKGIQLISRIYKTLDVQLALTDIFLHPTISSQLAIIEERRKGVASSNFIKKQPKSENIPVSFSQERLWFIDRLEGSTQYHIPAVLKLKGSLNVNALQFAFKQIINRHEVLRTVFIEKEGKIYQSIKSVSDNYVTIKDIQNLSNSEDGLKQHIEELVFKPFDLLNDTMLRADLLILEKDVHVLVVTLHHIASDGWSIPIIIGELVELYASFVESRKENLPELALQYADYAIWQRNYLEAELSEKLKYWKQKLDNSIPLELPTDFARPSIRGIKGKILTFEIDDELSQKISQFSADQGVTLYMTLLAAYNVLLFNYSRQTDISVGTSIANRPQLELEGLIGFFVNTLTLRNQLDPSNTFRHHLQEVKKTTIDAYEHQDVPFEKVVEAVVRERDQSRSPLFQVMLVLLNTPESSELKINEIDLTLDDFEIEISKFDLTFHVRETSSGLRISAEYSTDLFKESTIRGMLSSYRRILEQILQKQDLPISAIELIEDQQKTLLLEQGSSSLSNDPKQTVLEMLQEQTLQHPDRIALVSEGESLSYAALDKRSNQIAGALIAKGVRPGSAVLLYLEQAIDRIAGIVGILKSGGCYVPIDTDFPASRIEYILSDTGAGHILSTGSLIKTLEPTTAAFIDIEKLTEEPDNYPKVAIPSQSPAYVIYTSGSTGKPKGVVVSHGNLTDYVYGLDDRIQISQCTSYALVSSIATDLGNTVLYGSLVYGGTLHLFSKEAVRSAEYLQDYFKHTAIDCLKIVPSHWKALSEQGPLLPKKLLIFGGESLPGQTLTMINQTQSSCRVINHYGPTETTIGKLLHEADKNRTYGTSVPIGTPFGNTRVYVLSPWKQLCPVGVPGELYIAGAGLSQGYWNNEQLTQEKFIVNPIEPSPARLYATGDRVKYLEDGNIEYLGRIDDQVKIRGYRVEPMEIERMLDKSGLLQMAAIEVKQDSNGNKYLVAYVVAGTNYSKEKLGNYLKQNLPEYMIPGQTVEMESFPMLPNGKIDRRSLPDPQQTQSDQFVAPSTEEQKKMASIWEDILEVEQIGIHDDFFALGGHSLLAIRLVSAIRKAFAVEMPIGDIFDYPTIAELLPKLLIQTQGEILPPIKKAIPRPEKIPLSFSQERLWFVDQLEGSIQYHVPSVFKLKGKLNLKSIEYALKGIISRHEVLRTIIQEEGGKGYQIIKDTTDWKIEIIDNEELRSDPKKLETAILDLINHPFDLSSDYMLRSHLIKIDESEHVLVVTLHHISSDRWSTSIMVKELIELYSAYFNKIQPDLKPLPIQYADYAIWQRANLDQKILDKKLAYWKTKLDGLTPLQLPLDYQRTANWSVKGAVIPFQVNKDVMDGLIALSQKQGTTLFMTLLSAFKVLLHRYSSQQDICVGTSIANRQNQEIENLIGFFVNTLALRTEVQGELSFVDLLKRVKTTTLEAYEHQDAPFEKVVDTLVNERDMSRNALFQVLFVMHNTPEVPKLNVSDLELTDITNPHEVSRFDFTIAFNETENGLLGTIQYCTDLYKAETMQRLTGHFVNLVTAVIADPETKVGELNMLDDQEIEFLTRSVMPISFKYPENANVVDLFETQVDQNLQKIALVCEQESLSFSLLDESANKVANALLTNGLKPETTVAVYLERGVDMIVAILGILKAGGAYLPLDTEFPMDRVLYMLKDSEAQFVITNKQIENSLPEMSAYQTLDIKTLENGSGKRPSISIRPESLAYIIYTSGSTGEPKGVMITHRNLIDYYSGLIKNTPISESNSFALVSTIATDLGNTVIYASLLNGGALHVFSKEKVSHIEWLHQYFSDHAIDCIKIVPSHWKALSFDQKPLLPQKLLIFGGEALRPDLLEVLKDSPCVVVNHYGPTETTIGKLLHIVDRSKQYQTTVPIGKPFSKTEVYVLSDLLALCPVGIPGQLYIGGDGLARGYYNNSVLTEQKFINNPFGLFSDKLYGTGDLVKYLPDGNIEFIGRVDDQVKIRGYRVELGEIENILHKLPGINEAVVLAKKDQNEHGRLVAYVVADKDFTKDGALFQLKDKLPEYMIPSQFIVMDEFPLTPNGKIDKKALPESESDTQVADSFVAPSSEMEIALAKIWQELLGVEKVGIHDNFFDFGGDSIITLQFVSRARRAGYDLQPKDVFIYQTIEGLSSLIKQRIQKHYKIEPEQSTLSGPVGLLPIQHAFFEKETTAISHYNQSAIIGIDKRISESFVNEALNLLIAHHDALRMYYTRSEQGWLQAYGTTAAELIIEDFTQTDTTPLSNKIESTAKQYQAGLNIETGQVIRVLLIKTPSSESHNRLLIIVHHLVTDGVSWRILLEDLELLLSQLMDGKQADLGSKGLSYRQWHETLVKYGKSPKLSAQKTFWSSSLSHVQSLPVDMETTSLVSFKDRGTVRMSLANEFTKDLLFNVPKAFNTEINDILMLALVKTLTDYGRSKGIMVGLEGHGREQIVDGLDISRTVGWFTSVYPVWLTLDGPEDLGTYIKSIKEQLRSIPDKGLGFGVLKYLNKEASIPKEEPWEVLFNYLGQSVNMTGTSKWFVPAHESIGNNVNENHLFTKKMVINSVVNAGQLITDWNFSTLHFKVETIQMLVKNYHTNLESIINYCLQNQASGKTEATPSDFGLESLVSISELDKFLKEDDKDDIMSF